MTFAQFVGSGSTGIIGVLNTIVIPLIFAFAFLAFIWGVVDRFFLHAEEKRDEARSFVLWGIVGFVVLFGVWGLVNIALSTLGLSPGA